MEELSPVEHLKIAKRLHFQGLNDEAIQEYQLVLELDPENKDALAGLEALDAEVKPVSSSRRVVEPAAGLRTNFYVNQAKESQISAWRRGPVKVIVLAIGLIAAYGLYTMAITVLNWESIRAMENVVVDFKKPTQKEDGTAMVNVHIENYNPGPIKDVHISYSIADEKGSVLKEGSLTLPAAVPAGDTRTFDSIELGIINGKAGKMQAKPESLHYKKPKLKDAQVDAFISAAMKPDKDNFNDFVALADDTYDFAPAYVGLGRAYAAKEDYKRAIKEYTRAVELDPEDANVHSLMAIAYFYNNEKDLAKKEIEKAVSLAPEDPEVLSNQKYLLNLKDAPVAKKK